MQIHPSRIIRSISSDGIKMCLVPSGVLSHHLLVIGDENVTNGKSWLYAKKLGTILQNDLRNTFHDVNYYAQTKYDKIPFAPVHVIGRKEGDLPEDMIYSLLEDSLKNLDLSCEASPDEELIINEFRQCFQ